MLTEKGCTIRRNRLWQALPEECSWALIADPRHVNYLSGFHINPISLSNGERAYLLLDKNGKTVLFFDNFASFTSAGEYFADDTVVPTWYSKKYAVDNRDHILLDALTAEVKTRVNGPGLIETEWLPSRVDRALEDLQTPSRQPGDLSLGSVIRGLRRKKESDEIALLKEIMEASKAGHRKAMEVVEPGISELEIYLEVQKAALEKLGTPGIVYGDFRAVNAETPKRGGLPTEYRLQKGDMFILDYSVVLRGYRSDNTNTISAGIPSQRQQELYDLCLRAMKAGEKILCPGLQACDLFAAVAAPLEAAAIPDIYNRHNGHGLGLAHPEPPVIVVESTDTILERDVITLEPGAYVKGTGGVRIEHNYLITAEGYETLSSHELRLH
jgi:Xaa-Pro aminopeptidase